jgi:hypothetical protein
MNHNSFRVIHRVHSRFFVGSVSLIFSFSELYFLIFCLSSFCVLYQIVGYATFTEFNNNFFLHIVIYRQKSYMIERSMHYL